MKTCNINESYNLKSMPQLAMPSPQVLKCLQQLTQDKHNTVYIVSGRSMELMQVLDFKIKFEIQI